MEVFSQNYFPAIKDTPYPITLGPHTISGSCCEPPEQTRAQKDADPTPVPDESTELCTTLCAPDRTRNIARLCSLLSLVRRESAHRSRNAHCRSESTWRESGAQFWFVEVSYLDGAAEIYALPVQIATGEAAQFAHSRRRPIIARFAGAEEAVLHDAIWDANFREQLFRSILEGKICSGKSGEILGVTGARLTSDTKPCRTRRS